MTTSDLQHITNAEARRLMAFRARIREAQETAKRRLMLSAEYRLNALLNQMPEVSHA
jgi:hypothetical protein